MVDSFEVILGIIFGAQLLTEKINLRMEIHKSDVWKVGLSVAFQI